MLKKVLLAEKSPFLFGILLSVLGWGITHTADRLLKVNIVKYEESVTARPDRELHTFTITNISQTALADLQFQLHPTNGAAVLTQFPPEAVAPMTIDDTKVPTYSERAALFPLGEFQPGWSCRLIVATPASTDVRLTFLSPSAAVLLAPRGWHTFVVERETTLVSVIMGVATVLAAWYLVLIAKA